MIRTKFQGKIRERHPRAAIGIEITEEVIEMTLRGSMNRQRENEYVCLQGKVWPIHIDRTGFRFDGYSEWDGGSPYYDRLEGRVVSTSKILGGNKLI